MAIEDGDVLRVETRVYSYEITAIIYTVLGQSINTQEILLGLSAEVQMPTNSIIIHFPNTRKTYLCSLSLIFIVIIIYL